MARSTPDLLPMLSRESPSCNDSRSDQHADLQADPDSSHIPVLSRSPFDQEADPGSSHIPELPRSPFDQHADLQADPDSSHISELSRSPSEVALLKPNPGLPKRKSREDMCGGTNKRSRSDELTIQVRRKSEHDGEKINPDVAVSFSSAEAPTSTFKEVDGDRRIEDGMAGETTRSRFRSDDREQDKISVEQGDDSAQVMKIMEEIHEAKEKIHKERAQEKRRVKRRSGTQTEREDSGRLAPQEVINKILIWQKTTDSFDEESSDAVSKLGKSIHDVIQKTLYQVKLRNELVILQWMWKVASTEHSRTGQFDKKDLSDQVKAILDLLGVGKEMSTGVTMQQSWAVDGELPTKDSTDQPPNQVSTGEDDIPLLTDSRMLLCCREEDDNEYTYDDYFKWKVRKSSVKVAGGYYVKNELLIPEAIILDLDLVMYGEPESRGVDGILKWGEGLYSDKEGNWYCMCQDEDRLSDVDEDDEIWEHTREEIWKYSNTTGLFWGLWVRLRRELVVADGVRYIAHFVLTESDETDRTTVASSDC